jgi:hypothetical protein
MSKKKHCVIKITGVPYAKEVPVYGILIMWMATDLKMTLIIVKHYVYLSCKEKPKIIRTRKEIFPFP